MAREDVLIRLLGQFEILKMGKPVPLRPGGKAERLVSSLAIHAHAGLHRDSLVEHIWPDAPLALASQCLNTLMHSLKTQLADALGGQPPIVHTGSRYVLNLGGGLGVDVLEFESAVAAGHRLLSAGSTEPAIESYEHAVVLYRGDLTADSSISGLVERERLRAICLTTLARLGDAHFELSNYQQALRSAVRLLEVDPCREDAHRLAMRAYVRMGVRAQALRQYTLCRTILKTEFDAVPELATEQLFTLIRTDPAQV
jgi:DNA-binding SARP family transcriptional activator